MPRFRRSRRRERIKKVYGRGSLVGLIATIIIAFFFFNNRGLWWIGALMILGALSPFINELTDRVHETPPMTSNSSPLSSSKADLSPKETVVRPNIELPSNCANCGAPTRTNDVQWHGSTAACAYCGSTLKAKI